MGRSIEVMAPAEGHEIVARIDPSLGAADISPSSLAGADVAIEFTTPQAAPGNLIALARSGVDAVCGTTGWTEHLPDVRKAVGDAGTGLLYASNFSLGVHLFLRAAGALALAVQGSLDDDVTISETHHQHKLDRPSGTAITLAERLLAHLPSKARWAADEGEGEGEGEAASDGQKSPEADPMTLLISSEREGEVPGTHTVIFQGPDDGIELTHRARSRAGFTRGALAGASWIRGRVGVFTMDDYLVGRLDDVEGTHAAIERRNS